MVDSFVSGLTQVFHFSTFALMLLGILIGFAVGILPGLGGGTALALMLPFVVKMNPFEAFSFLLGMTAVTNTTGDITSILLGVPGEPTTAATILDGHPMAKKGEAGRALGAALMSSLIGAIFGAFGLATAIPLVRPLVLALGSPEFFMLALLGVTFVVALSGEAFLKGVIAGGIGLFLSTVGLCQMSGIERFTFGQTFLWDGIGLVPITIGFFAIPEVIDLAVKGTSIAPEMVGKVGGVWQGVQDTFRHFWMVIRCSAIGTYTSVVPGLGAATTQWLAYAHAVQTSPDQERFGKGAVEGVLGPGAANNSTLGGSLITTVAFGVPASVMMAILLGAFLIQGIVPGPAMLTPEPRGHLALTFSFVWINVISNIITVAVCLVFLQQLVKVTFIRGSILIPLIMLLIYLGAFTEKNALADMLLVLCFGALGWALHRLHWPRPPLILGLVLGTLAENRLFISVDNYGLSWLLRPGVLILIGITLFAICWSLHRLKKKRAEAPTPTYRSSSTLTRIPPKSLTFDSSALFTSFIIFVFVLALWESKSFDFRSGLFPWFIGSIVLFLSIIQLVIDMIGREDGWDIDPSTGFPWEIDKRVVNRRTAYTFAWVVAYLLSIWLFGFIIGGPLCAFLQFKFYYREKWSLTLALTAGLWCTVYIAFGRLLHVPFPPGELPSWF